MARAAGLLDNSKGAGITLNGMGSLTEAAYKVSRATSHGRDEGYRISLACTIIILLGAAVWTAAHTSSPRSEPIVVFIGDSYTSGSREGGNDDANYTRRLGREFGFGVINTAVGGAGYAVAPPGKTTFSGQLAGLLSVQDPQLIIVQGSLNDVLTTPVKVRAAADQLFANLKALRPRARIVVVGPIVPEAAFSAANVLVVRDTVRDAAYQAQLPFVDPILERWLSADLIGTDQVHPTDAGHQRIAEALGRDLERLDAL